MPKVTMITGFSALTQIRTQGTILIQFTGLSQTELIRI